MIKFWWVRHAPVIGNDNCCYGNNEVDCDTSNIKSFKSLASKLPNEATIYTSGLSRAIKTYWSVKKLKNISINNIVDKRLEEQNLGDLTGLKYNDLTTLAKKNNFFSENWLTKPDYIPPNGESYNNLLNRVNQFLSDIIKMNKNENIIIFSHGGPIRAALSIALHYKKNDVININIENTKLTKIDYINKSWHINSINE